MIHIFIELTVLTDGFWKHFFCEDNDSFTKLTLKWRLSQLVDPQSWKWQIIRKINYVKSKVTS